MSSGRRSFQPLSLAVRVGLWYSIALLVGLAAVAALTYALLVSALKGRDRDVIRSALIQCAARFETSGLFGIEQVIEERRMAGDQGDVFVRVTRGGSGVLFYSSPGRWRGIPFERLGSPPAFRQLLWGELPGPNGDTFDVASLRLPEGTLFQVGRSSRERREIVRRFEERLVSLLFLIGAASIGGGLWVTRINLRPLEELSAAVRQTLETGSLEARVPVRGTDDPLDQLGASFNSMLERIGQLVKAMRESLDSVAHDLKTPLSRLRAKLEGHLNETGARGSASGALADGLEEVDRATALVNGLLDIAEAEAGAARLDLESIPAAELVRDVIDLFAEVMDEKRLEAAVEIPEGLLLTADRTQIRRVLTNLVDNAVKYSSPGGRLRIAGRAEPDASILEVEDSGPGIAPEDLPHIFDRLYRADRSRAERGLGLGLAIARAIVSAHGGTLGAESEVGRGTRFSLRLPLRPGSHLSRL